MLLPAAWFEACTRENPPLTCVHTTRASPRASIASCGAPLAAEIKTTGFPHAFPAGRSEATTERPVEGSELVQTTTPSPRLFTAICGPTASGPVGKSWAAGDQPPVAALRVEDSITVLVPTERDQTAVTSLFPSSASCGGGAPAFR